MKHISQRHFLNLKSNECLMIWGWIRLISNNGLGLCYFLTHFLPFWWVYVWIRHTCVLIHGRQCGLPWLTWTCLAFALPAFCLTLFGFVFKSTQTVCLLPSRPKTPVSHTVSQWVVQQCWPSQHSLLPCVISSVCPSGYLTRQTQPSALSCNRAALFFCC